MQKLSISKSVLEDLYKGQRLTTKEIAIKYNCDPETIRLKLVTYGIKRRRDCPRYIPKIHMPDNIEKLAYLAGIVDGEGSIFLARSKRSIGQVYPTISVKNTNKALMDWLHFEFGGTVGIAEKPKNSGHKIAYAWRVYGVLDVEMLLKAIEKYLIIKSSNAIIVREFCTKWLARVD